MNQNLELILMSNSVETATEKAALAREFVESQHTILEFGLFFQWVANELSKGNLEFAALIYSLTALDMQRARLLSIWLFRIVDFIPINKEIK